MIVRTLSTFARRITTALVIGAAAVSVPAIALASAPTPAPTAAVKAAPADVAKVAADGKPLALKVTRHAIAQAVEDRAPVGTVERVQPGAGALYAWVTVKNLGAATTITMVWKKDGKERLAVTLPVGHAWGWKTWSKKGIGDNDAGHWTVDVKDEGGAVLETLAFEVESGAPALTVGAFE